jgi:hypothetical protein
MSLVSHELLVNSRKKLLKNNTLFIVFFIAIRLKINH